MMRKTFIVALLLLSCTILRSQDGWISKVSPSIITGLQDGEEVECLIQLHDTPDLRRAKTIRSKGKKGQYVFSNLRKTAESSQRALIDWLKAKGRFPKSLYIVNLIKVSLDQSMIEAIAKRPE
ncbi:MAG: hypothetical protein HKN68_16305, partial [Saprospiraceae bacterium]|nr:hypothetical protein [Saprospiraceae bacterium]